MKQNITRALLTEFPPVPQTALTREAARIINRQPQTLRIWACRGTGPIKPVRIHGRLHWRIADLDALLQGQTSDLRTLRTRLDARQIAEIVTGFFAILAESARAASPDSLTARP